MGLLNQNMNDLQQSNAPDKLTGGSYRLKMAKVYELESKNGGVIRNYFVVEGYVTDVRSGGESVTLPASGKFPEKRIPAVKVGQYRTLTINTGNTMGLQDVNHFIAAAAGIDPSDKARLAGFNYNDNLKEILSAENPCRDELIDVDVIFKVGKDTGIPYFVNKFSVAD